MFKGVLRLGLPMPVLASMAAMAAHAQEPVQIPGLVVTATSQEQSLRDAPATVTVITREELQERPVQDIADALRDVPGVTTNGVGLNRRGISIRGMSEKHTLMLVDGKRINASAGAIAHADYDLNWVPIEAIERIEVVRGPMSSLYGSDALGGVVNIITRKATDVWRGGVSAKGGLQQGSGGDIYQGGVSMGGPIVPGRLGLSVQGQMQGRQMTDDPDDPYLSENERRKSKMGGATLTWTPDDAQRIDMSYGYGREERERKQKNRGASAYYYDSTDKIDRQHFSLAHQGDWEWGKTSLKAYRSRLDQDNERSQGEPNRPQKLIDDVVDGHVNLPVLGWNQVTFGGEWRREKLADAAVNDAGKDKAVYQALFLQDELALAEDWSLLLGNRSDHHETFGWNHSPRAYLVHHMSDALTVKGGVARGFKAPTLKQLSSGYSTTGGGGRFTIVGNPDLEPEINTMYEFGMEYEKQGRSLGATLFQNDLKDLIQTQCVAFCGQKGKELRTYGNVEEARIRGVELSGGLDLSDQFRLNANYTYLQPKDRKTGHDLSERPRHKASAVLSWFASDNVTARLRSDYTGRQNASDGSVLPGYPLWSADISRSLDNGVVLRAGVQNIADMRLSERKADYPYAETGRLLWAGINYSF